ncbi:MAG TPA: hypothetical protein VNO19_10375 [Gemmatimonadales bacterium]|nr:hypothetical protein [Gemmatimonadales bacterium]
MLAAFVILAACALAAFTYLGLERMGRRAWIPLACRAIAWSALGLLLVNVSCPVSRAPLRPLVLLDGSLSMGGAGGRWAEARDSAARWGEVRLFGDARSSPDSTPSRGRSLLGPALLAGSVSDRPLIVVTDGEVEDVREIPPDLLARSGVRLFLRAARPDLAVTRVTGPSRVSETDSVLLEVEIQPTGGNAADGVRVEVLSGTRRLAFRNVRLRGESGGRARILVPAGSLSSGGHLLRVALAGGGDAEPRTDARLHLVTVAPTPGVVLLAAPADWDSRFLYRTLREVGQLPIQGYVRLDGDRWRSMANLRRVPGDVVRRAVRRADLLIIKGGASDLAKGTTARGIWSWPSGEGGETQVPGDWYLSQADASPVAGAFLGQPVDSFPPAFLLTPMESGPRDWVALYAQLGRRGPQRPAVFGRQEGRVRRITVAVEGLWRWPFRGASSEQTYRSWVAATTSWLLGGVDSARGVASPVQAVVQNGRPIIFEWLGPGQASPQSVAFSSTAGQRTDTLHFDGDGRASVWLQPGEYRYRLPAGGGGIVAVEEYSDELLPRTVTLITHDGRNTRSAGRTAARDWLWLFGICVLALSGEWLARRRLGLR